MLRCLDRSPTGISKLAWEAPTGLAHGLQPEAAATGGEAPLAGQDLPMDTLDHLRSGLL